MALPKIDLTPEEKQMEEAVKVAETNIALILDKSGIKPNRINIIALHMVSMAMLMAAFGSEKTMKILQTALDGLQQVGKEVDAEIEQKLKAQTDASLQQLEDVIAQFLTAALGGKATH